MKNHSHRYRHRRLLKSFARRKRSERRTRRKKRREWRMEDGWLSREASWTAPALRRFSRESGAGPPHSKTLRRIHDSGKCKASSGLTTKGNLMNPPARKSYIVYRKFKARVGLISKPKIPNFPHLPFPNSSLATCHSSLVFYQLTV